jgi:hypothetical protein
MLQKFKISNVRKLFVLTNAKRSIPFDLIYKTICHGIFAENSLDFVSRTHYRLFIFYTLYLIYPALVLALESCGLSSKRRFAYRVLSNNCWGVRVWGVCVCVCSKKKEFHRIFLGVCYRVQRGTLKMFLTISKFVEEMTKLFINIYQKSFSRRQKVPDLNGLSENLF